MVRASRAAVLALAVVPLLSACREVSQSALDGTADRDVLVPVEQNGAWGYITGRGTLAIPPRFERAYRFVNNRALVRRDGRYGFIDTSGAAVIPPTFAAAGPFADGLAPVRPDNLWGFVDRTGTTVIPPRFAAARDFRAGLARVRLPDGRMGYVTPDGTIVWPPDAR